ncbi:MAG: hypothetical protein ACYSO7_09015 [Planctomycetota bacterium]|jgi:hypothetical protein
MKAKMTNVAVLVLIILVSMGCSSSPKVYYGVGKAYARNPETGKIMSWKYKAAEGSRHERVDAAGSDLGYLVTGLLDMAIN